MECQMCGAEATFHYTEIMNDKVVDLHLCQSCAEKKGLSKDNMNISIPDNIMTDLSNFNNFVEKEQKTNDIICAKCKLKFSQFQKTGKFGCSFCYSEFSEELKPLLKRIQGSLQHVGKKAMETGSNDSNFDKIKVMKEKLQQCVAKEEYEEAAKYRDEIKKLLKPNNDESTKI